MKYDSTAFNAKLKNSYKMTIIWFLIASLILLIEYILAIKFYPFDVENTIRMVVYYGLAVSFICLLFSLFYLLSIKAQDKLVTVLIIKRNNTFLLFAVIANTFYFIGLLLSQLKPETQDVISSTFAILGGFMVLLIGLGGLNQNDDFNK